MRSLCILSIWTTTILLGPTVFAADYKQHVRLGNFSEAARLLQNEVDTGNSEAAYELGRLIWRGFVENRTQDEAIDLYRTAARSGHVDAMYVLGSVLSKSDAAPEQQHEGATWLSNAAQQGHQKAQRLVDTKPSQPAQLQNNKPSITRVNALLADCKTADLRKLLKANQIEESQGFAYLLQGAVRCDSPKLIKQLQRRGADIFELDANGNSLLHIAVANGSVRSAKFLLKKGMDKGKKNTEAWSPMMLAERSNEPKLLKLFGITEQTTNTSHEDIAELIKQDARFSNWSPLAAAAWRGEIELVKALIQSHKTSIEKPDQSGKTPFNRAVTNNQLESATMLAAHHQQFLDEDVQTAVAQGKTFIELMVDKNLTRPQQDQVACGALMSDASFALQQIINNGWDGKANCNEKPALITATIFGSKALIKTLLNQTPLAVDTLDDEGCSALCWALRKNKPGAAQLLLDAGATNLADTQGVTPLHLASSNGQLEVIKALAIQGIDLESSTNNGSTGLMLAVLGGQNHVVDYFLQNTIKVDAKNTAGDTALILAVKHDNFDASQALLAAGASSAANNNQFESAYELAQNKKQNQWLELFEKESGLWKLLGGI